MIPVVGTPSDRIGRHPPIILGAPGPGLRAFGCRNAISIHPVPLTVGLSMLIRGVVSQGHNAAFPSFCPKLCPAWTRVVPRAISQHIGTTLTAMLPAPCRMA